MKNIDKLTEASLIALRDYMGVSQDETLLIISDCNLREIGLNLFEVGKTLALETFYIEMKPREMNGEEPPEQIAKMMQEVDVVVCPTTKSLTHTEARRKASEAGVRIGTMPGITVDTMTRCLSADYKKIIELSEYVAEKLENSSVVRVYTKLGTDISFAIKKRKPIISTGVLRKIGEWGNLPSGEVYLAPWENKINGTIVFDGSVAGIGVLKSPITVKVEDGLAVSISGQEEAEKLKAMLEKVGKKAHQIGEFGIGTNYKAKIIGQILEDEKVKGTVHFAFGNNLSMGGKNNAPIHIDGIVKKPTFYFDNELIMEEGKFVEQK